MNFIKSVYLCITISYVCTCVTTIDVPLLDTAKNPFVYLEENNYPYENHTITTKDGYILLLVRIPHDRNALPTNTIGPPVLFVHGILNCFYDFLNAGPGEAIGFEALENGYDIWMLNTRGNTYSRRHVTLDPDLNPAAFWNFSWHDSGMWDAPAAIDYITSLTGTPKVSYVAHSQGTAIFLSMAASRPEYNAKINIAVLLAPIAFLAHAQSLPLVFFKNNLELAYAIFEILQPYEVLRHNNAVGRAGQLLCNLESPALVECGLYYQTLLGQSNQVNYSMISVELTTTPAGTSTKGVFHYLQMAHSGEFQLYDYGTTGNQIAYNQTTPPSYNLSKITAPVALIYGLNDVFVSVTDAARLAGNLPNLVTNHIIPFEGTNHMDVLWGTMAVPLVHQPVISWLNQYNSL